MSARVVVVVAMSLLRCVVDVETLSGVDFEPVPEIDVGPVSGANVGPMPVHDIEM